MKKFLAFLLICAMICIPPVSSAEHVIGNEINFVSFKTVSGLEEVDVKDSDFPLLAANELYLDIGELLALEGYSDSEIHVDVAFYPKEYIKTLASNSQENIYFGYKLSELDELFAGKRYYFTCDDNGETIVKEFEPFEDNIYNQVLRNVAVGVGIIVVSVTITLATGGFGVPVVAGSTVSAINIIFSTAATQATFAALSGGLMSTVVTGATVAMQTNDWEEVQKAALLAGSEGFMWGAVVGTGTGMVSGAATYAKALKALKSAKALPQTPIDDIIKQTPVDGKTGKWVDGTRGNGKFISDDPAAQKALMEKGVDGIIYNNGVPDFSSVADDAVEISGSLLDKLSNPNSTQVRRAMQSEAKEILANKRGVSVRDIEMWMKDNGLTIHEDINMTSLYFVKTEINRIFSHLGGVSEYLTRISQAI